MNKQMLIVGFVALVILGFGLLYIATTGGVPETQSTAREASEVSGTTEIDQTERELTSRDSAIGTITASPAADESHSKFFTVEGSNFKFTLSEIRVKKGDTVTITFVNKDGFHDWVLDEFNVRTKQLKTGESETVTFTADTVGTFEYYCSVGSHRAMGMKGTLLVE